MLIFNIFKIRRLYKEAKENPGKVAGEELSGTLMRLVLIPAIIFGAILALFFMLGFTTLLFGYGPFTLAKILFYISLPIYLLTLFIVWRVARRLQRHTETLANSAIDSLKNR